MLKSWMKLTSDAALLGFEAQQVIGLRLLRIAAGARLPASNPSEW
jgi:hypothetical protein